MMILRVFFVTDLHGSDVCFKKFLNVAHIYKPNILILAGDITGKMIFPLVEGPEGIYTATFLGKKWQVKTREEIEELEKKISNSGYYPIRTTPDELEKLRSDKSKFDELFLKLASERLENWIELAAERLRRTNIKLLISLGNDDPIYTQDFIERIIKKCRCEEYIHLCEEKKVNLNGNHEMISMGYSSPTPWKTPRECDEELLRKKIETLISEVNDIKSSIFNFHCPPINTPIDTAPKLDENLKPIASGGIIQYTSAGSKAVKDAILKCQPLLGLHGHIHESKGVVRLGRTLCINPGSEYLEGILRGCLLTLEKNQVKSFLFTSG
jgi:Icc-related predicted phosphoesterase